MDSRADEDKYVRVITEENCDVTENQDKKDKKFTAKEKMEILKEIHESPIGGHAGMNKTYKRFKHFINWQEMKHDVEEYIRKCEKCKKNKMTQCHTRLPLTITNTSSTVFEKCTVDIVGLLNPSMIANRYILTVQDGLSKFLIAVPLVEQTAEEFVDNVILVYGI
jgi:hypothetical protein